jgi:hypothetical protein
MPISTLPRCLGALLLLAAGAVAAQTVRSSWRGALVDAAGRRIAGARIELRSEHAAAAARTASDGTFEFVDLAPGRYTPRVEWSGGSATGAVVEVADGAHRTESLRVAAGGTLALEAAGTAVAGATGGEQLSGRQVSALPLNKRDFSQLLLLAAGTQTDANGAANFTQQFTMNGQRGTASVFAMDGIDTTDPEMGGATFSNFNVDAIEEIKSNSGVLAPEFGHGAAGFTEVITKPGTNDLHGSVFEFVRNAAFDARNFFDRRSVAEPGRLPAFSRNEFGFTNGGPVFLPHLYNGRDRTFYFFQYQGFRQVLGTTQIIPVPTVEERAGRDSTAYAGDVLIVPVSPKIKSVLAAYPLPNDANGPYGARTYATSSKVRTTTDQFSVRFDHRISEKSHLFARFNLNDVDGPLTNPSQTAIDPSFAIRFYDHQRNFGASWVNTPSATFTSETSLGFTRSTPLFPTTNSVQPALIFADSTYEGFNSAAGQIMGAFGNLFQLRQNFTWIRGKHTWKAGGEVRLNRDTTVFGTSPNGTYTFGGGAAYSTVEIRSLSGLHDIHVGDALPDALSGFLSATPFAYTVTAAPELFAQGQRMGVAAIRREAYNVYIQDTWNASPRFSITYGLRYEVNSCFKETKRRTSGLVFEDANGTTADPMAAGVTTRFLINKQPAFPMDWSGVAPRVAFDWRIDDRTVFHAGGAITTLLPNLWQDNLVTGGLPFVVTPSFTAAPGVPVPFESSPVKLSIPAIYAIDGSLIYATGRSTDVAANTEMDVLRFERDLAALSPDKQTRPTAGLAMASDFGNGYIGTYTAGLERKAGDITLSAAYVATIGAKLARLDYPNGYTGASGAYAPYTVFDSNGTATGGYGSFPITTNHSHSSYHSLQTSAQKKSLRAGLGFQASYTFAKSIDDSSAVLGGAFTGASGTVLQTLPQNPRDLHSEKAPSTFDIKHAVSFSAIQELSLKRVPVLRAAGRRFTGGWELLAMGSMSSGAPFTVYSGLQQTAAGAAGADRPDQVGVPTLSTSRTIREDYFGLGANNTSYFSIPTGVAGGTGPNQGRFGSLGRNTFRGPAFHNFDFSVIKNTPIGPGNNPERAVAQFRAEFFNIFNIVNLGLPANIVLGPGFGVINKTAGPSRQIQFSLKILY